MKRFPWDKSIMRNVIELDDPFTYTCDNGVFRGVTWQRGTRLLNIDNDGSICCTFDTSAPVPKHELKQLMIMWLALNYPDCLKFDDLEKEETIRNDTK